MNKNGYVSGYPDPWQYYWSVVKEKGARKPKRNYAVF